MDTCNGNLQSQGESSWFSLGVELVLMMKSGSAYLISMCRYNHSTLAAFLLISTPALPYFHKRFSFPYWHVFSLSGVACHYDLISMELPTSCQVCIGQRYYLGCKLTSGVSSFMSCPLLRFLRHYSVSLRQSLLLLYSCYRITEHFLFLGGPTITRTAAPVSRRSLPLKGEELSVIQTWSFSEYDET